MRPVNHSIRKCNAENNPAQGGGATGCQLGVRHDRYCIGAPTALATNAREWYISKKVFRHVRCPMKRREFIKKTGQAVALAAVTGGAGLFFNNRESSAYSKLAFKTADFEIAADSAFPKVVLARSIDHSAALRSSLDAIGGIGRFIKKGDRVVLKPNIGWDRTPEQAANTNPILVGEMARLCLSAGAVSVIVTDVPCNEPKRTFLRSGIREAAEKAGATVILPEEQDFVTVDLGGKIAGERPVLKYFLECDRLINMPIVKHHTLAGFTSAMKNFYGLIGGHRGQLHQDIDQSIVDLAAFARPTLTIADATRVLLRNGPTGGSLDDVSIQNCVITATDQVAADARAVEFLGLTADQVACIPMAARAGLGLADYKKAGYKEILS